MQINFGLDTLVREWPEAVVCIGTFDGIHLGHQAVIGSAVAHARGKDQPACLVTFDRHPASTLRPDRCPPTLTPLNQRLEEFEKLGVSLTLILPFDRDLSETPAEQFLNEILVKRLGATQLVIGQDFGFGKDRQGDGDWLRSRIPTLIVPPLNIGGERVSSSLIRKAVTEGDVETAHRFLGRPFSISGVVVGGRKLGRTLGYPTVNLARSTDQATPADGVYAGRCRLESPGTHPHAVEFAAAISIGTRPAVAGEGRTIEAYLLDYPGDSLYGQSVRLEVWQRLREERDYSTLAALTDQIALDVSQVRRLAQPLRN